MTACGCRMGWTIPAGPRWRIWHPQDDPLIAADPDLAAALLAQSVTRIELASVGGRGYFTTHPTVHGSAPVSNACTHCTEHPIPAAIASNVPRTGCSIRSTRIAIISPGHSADWVGVLRNPTEGDTGLSLKFAGSMMV